MRYTHIALILAMVNALFALYDKNWSAFVDQTYYESLAIFICWLMNGRRSTVSA